MPACPWEPPELCVSSSLVLSSFNDLGAPCFAYWVAVAGTVRRQELDWKSLGVILGYTPRNLPMQTMATKVDPVLLQLNRIEASPGFARNARLAAFLRFVVERKLDGRTNELKEIVIGVEVFGRKADYAPRYDPVVRMEAAKLRARLAEYYAGPGKDDPVRIEIPKGGYVPQWDVRGIRSKARLKWFIVAALTLGFAAGGIAVWHERITRYKASIAVLPFLNLSAEPDSEYFSDGVTEEVMQLLSTIEGLEVISRTSSFALRDSRLGAPEIGAKLNATLLMEGTVRKLGNHLRVTAELIRTSDGRSLWSNTYDREMRDVFVVQEEIAGSIVNALRLKLGGAHHRYTDNLEAYELYLRSRYAFEHRQARSALQYSEQAVSKDANYALAHASAADAFLMLEMDHMMPYVEAHSAARRAAERAREIDRMLSEAHAALAEIALREYAWQEAERGFHRAIELNPNNAEAHIELGWSLLMPLDRIDEAAREVRRAVDLDPLSWRTNYLAGFALFLMGLSREAVQYSEKAITLDPSRPEPYRVIARASSTEGRHTQAIDIARKAHIRAPEGGASWTLACVSARAGQRDEAVRLLNWNLETGRTPVPNRRFLLLYACLGDKERAFEYLEKMYDEHEPALPVYLLYPEVAWMRSDPRFTAFRQKVGLPLSQAGRPSAFFGRSGWKSMP
jgi:TolB-like protein/Tfp pilus assembly protein PilF